MSAKTVEMADVTLHIDENITHGDREALRDKLLDHDGVMAASYHDEKPHLLMVEYNPDIVSSKDLLEVVESLGVHAELIGL
jgi:hypothetical protein